MNKLIVLTDDEKEILRLILKGRDVCVQDKALISDILEKTNTKNLLQSAIFCLKEDVLWFCI